MDEILVIPTNGRHRTFRRGSESRNVVYCTGTDDDLTIERALNDLNSTRGGRVRLAEGTFNTTGTINLPNLGGDGGRVSLVGSGMLSSIINPAAGLTSVIDLDGAHNHVGQLGISGRGAADTVASDGIHINAVQCLVSDVHIQSTKGDAIEITIGASEAVVNRNVIKSCLRNGIRATSSSDYYITNNVIRQCGTNQGASKPTDWTGADSTRFFGILAGGSCIIGDNHIWGCDTGVGGNGLNASTITRNLIADNYMGCVEIYSSTNASYSNTFTANALYTTSGLFPGGKAVYVWDTGGHADNVFLGNTLYDGNTIWAVAFDLASGTRTLVALNHVTMNRNSATGISVAAACTNTILNENSLTLSGTTPTYISDSGSGTASWNNVYGGSPTVKRGATSVADGGTITHGLATTPTRVLVTLSKPTELAAVTAASSTTFTVAIKKPDGTAGTTQTVYWVAEV